MCYIKNDKLLSIRIKNRFFYDRSPRNTNLDFSEDLKHSEKVQFVLFDIVRFLCNILRCVI